MSNIITEKVEQAVGVLDELGIHCWLTFVRETAEGGDPVLPLILGQSLTWQSALIITRDGQRIAIVGKYEDDAVRSSGAWIDVRPYVQGISDPLRKTLIELDPQQIAINYSVDDVKADGLSHGMYELLLRYLRDTPFADRLISAAEIIGAVRGRKTPTEVHRMRDAIATTDEIFAAVADFAKPGITECAISEFMHEEVHKRGLSTSWEEAMCPIVSTGPGSMIGHGLPSDELTVRRGCLFHLDFGVQQNGYCSDIQRAWWVPQDNDPKPPDDIRKAFDTVRTAIENARAILKPGIEGWQVDQAARQTVIDAGYPEYQHATGHHVGRAAHDGAGVLGPKWERYGNTPMRKVEAGNVFTLELGVETDHGYLGLEEMLLVTEAGAEYLTTPQTELPLLPM